MSAAEVIAFPGGPVVGAGGGAPPPLDTDAIRRWLSALEARVGRMEAAIVGLGIGLLSGGEMGPAVIAVLRGLLGLS